MEDSPLSRGLTEAVTQMLWVNEPHYIFPCMCAALLVWHTCPFCISKTVLCNPVCVHYQPLFFHLRGEYFRPSQLHPVNRKMNRSSWGFSRLLSVQTPTCDLESASHPADPSWRHAVQNAGYRETFNWLGGMEHVTLYCKYNGRNTAGCSYITAIYAATWKQIKVNLCLDFTQKPLILIHHGILSAKNTFSCLAVVVLFH